MIDTTTRRIIRDRLRNLVDEFGADTMARVLTSTPRARAAVLAVLTAQPLYPDPQTYDAQGNPRTKRLALDPDLTDGEHWTIHDEPNEVLLDLIRAWMAEAVDGDEITIKLRTMSEAEAEALPQI